MQYHPFIQLRSGLHQSLPSRRDAIINLIDALCAHGYTADSAVKLSTSPYFEREYSSITKAISAASSLSKSQWQGLFNHMQGGERVNHFAIDVTGNPRPYAPCMKDRSINYSPNPAPGNKPIAVGHNYSVIVGQPNKEARLKHWVKPMSVTRVETDKKGNEVGMQQMSDLLTSLRNNDSLNISFGDTSYSTNNCRSELDHHCGWVHVARFRSNRNIYLQPDVAYSGHGKPIEYGRKISLSEHKELPKHDDENSHQLPAHKGETYTLTLRRWNNVLTRGTRKFRGSHNAFDLIQVMITKADGASVYKRPMYLGLFGERRQEVSCIDAYQGYRWRYDIEHFFRFGKNKLLMDKHQTTEIINEEAWWNIVLIAYLQLYQARDLTQGTPYPWERFLPIYQDIKPGGVSTPSNTQRGMGKLLDIVGSPAQISKIRGKSPGRQAGVPAGKRERHPIVFKGRAKSKDNNQEIDIPTQQPNPQIIDSIIVMITEHLTQYNFSPQKLITSLSRHFA